MISPHSGIPIRSHSAETAASFFNNADSICDVAHAHVAVQHDHVGAQRRGFLGVVQQVHDRVRPADLRDGRIDPQDDAQIADLGHRRAQGPAVKRTAVAPLLSGECHQIGGILVPGFAVRSRSDDRTGAPELFRGGKLAAYAVACPCL